MSVDFGYSTVEIVPPELEGLVRVDLNKFQASSTPWIGDIDLSCETLPNGSNKLYGFTRIIRNRAFVSGEWQDISEADDIYMSGRDIYQIVTGLTRVAGRHGLTWNVNLELEHVGSVGPNGPDLNVRNMISELTGVQLTGCEQIDVLAVESRAASILARYPPDNGIGAVSDEIA